MKIFFEKDLLLLLKRKNKNNFIFISKDFQLSAETFSSFYFYIFFFCSFFNFYW